jgi:hypothetical protein
MALLPAFRAPLSPHAPGTGIYRTDLLRRCEDRLCHRFSAQSQGPVAGWCLSTDYSRSHYRLQLEQRLCYTERRSDQESRMAPTASRLFEKSGNPAASCRGVPQAIRLPGATACATHLPVNPGRFFVAASKSALELAVLAFAIARVRTEPVHSPVPVCRSD